MVGLYVAVSQAPVKILFSIQTAMRSTIHGDDAAAGSDGADVDVVNGYKLKRPTRSTGS